MSFQGVIVTPYITSHTLFMARPSRDEDYLIAGLAGPGFAARLDPPLRSVLFL